MGSTGVDLKSLAREAKRNAPGGPGGVDMSRGVDLGLVRNKKLHQHRWILALNFAVDDKTMAQVNARMMQVTRLKEKADLAGIQLTEADIPPNVPIATTEENCVSVDGPGCIKCQTAWNAHDGSGWGALCPVSDTDWEKRVMAGQGTVTAPMAGG